MKTLITLSTLLSLIWAFFLAVDAGAQGLPRPTFSVEGDIFANSEFDKPSETALRGNSSEVGTTAFQASASYPIILKQGADIYFIEASYKQRQFDRHDWPVGVSLDPDRLHEINLSITYRTMFSQRWAAIFNLSPQLASDFSDNELHGDDFKLQGAFIMERMFSEHWTLGFGAAYATTFGKPFPLPLFTFRYESGGRWSAEGNLPASVEVNYRAASNLTTGFLVSAEGGQYHTPDLFPADMKIDNPQVQYIQVTGGPTLRLQPAANLALTLRGGLAYQGVRLYDGNDETPNSNYDLKPSAFARAGLELSL